MRALRYLALLMVLSTVGVPALGYYPRTPARVNDILYARPFTVQQGYRSYWHRDIPIVVSGYIVVLAIEPNLGKPRAGAMPVLLAGNNTVEEFNFGYPSGLVVGIIPGVADLAQTLIWFGPFGYSDEMTTGMIAASKADAIAAGIGTLPADRISEALAAGGPPLVVPNRPALLQHVLSLIETYNAAAGE